MSNHKVTSAKTASDHLSFWFLHHVPFATYVCYRYTCSVYKPFWSGKISPAHNKLMLEHVRIVVITITFGTCAPTKIN